MVKAYDRKDDRKHGAKRVSIFPSYLGEVKFSGVGRKGEAFNWTEALTRVSLIRKGMVSRLACAYPVQIRKLWMNRYLPFMRLTNAANISKLCPVPLNTN